MSDQDVTTELTEEAHETRAHHPPDSLYVRVFVFLVVVTAMEVATSYIEAFKDAHVEVGILVVLMAIKFFTVTYYFMHLKFDPVVLRRVFNFSLSVAVSVFVIALAMFEFWAPHFH